MIQHNKWDTRVYRIWSAMKTRCLNKNHMHYHRYGGRGITVCPGWIDSFAVFYQDMGDPPSTKHSLDRIDNDKGYNKYNCRWATPREQMQNAVITHNVTAFGKTQSLIAWQRELGICRNTIRKRIERGETLEQIVANPPKHKTYLTAYGKTLNMTQWANKIGVTHVAIRYHLERGKTMEQIVDRFTHH